jgi:6,7-dimethyl-8-ribityllumazine synthase
VGALDAGRGAGSPRFAIAVARFNDLVTRPLLAGALDGFARHGAGWEAVDVSWFEAFGERRPCLPAAHAWR